MPRIIGLVLLAVVVAAPAVSAEATLRVLGRWGLGSDVYAVVESFEAANPDVTIEVEDVSFNEYMQRLLVQYAAGVAPDVIFPATYQTIELAADDALLPLDRWMDPRFLNEFIPSSLELYSYDGHLYGLPNDIAALATYINTDHFDEAGLPYNFNHWDWDEFLETLQKLTLDTDGDLEIDRFGLEHLGYFSQFIWSATGTGLFDSATHPTEFLLNQPAAIEALQFLQDLRWAHHVTPQPGEPAAFTAGQSSATIGGHWSMSGIMSAGFNWQLLPLPRKAVQVQRGDGSGWSIMASTEHPEEAARLVEYLAGEEGQTMLARIHFGTSTYLPVLQGIWLNPPGLPDGINKLAFLEGTDNLFSQYEVHHPIRNALFAHIDPAIRQVLAGNASPEQAIGEIVEPVRSVLRQVEAMD